MAKKSIIEREKKRNFLSNKYYLLRQSLKEKIKISNTFEEKFSLYFQIQSLPKNSAVVRLHNRCLITGRPKGFYRFFGLSRHVIREMAYLGNFPGLVKSSW
uniref:Small ribosomal subunit protein uS14c n=1 Tax=Phacus pleuronectes TaxID=102908 RepID=A0A3G3LLV3_9EUGL|nr:ribosomal protein S14 [Phacus pleuronectes]AYQ93692.1 ribosomal protein S14 [Phacus pleuronectes]